METIWINVTLFMLDVESGEDGDENIQLPTTSPTPRARGIVWVVRRPCLPVNSLPCSLRVMTLMTHNQCASRVTLLRSQTSSPMGAAHYSSVKNKPASAPLLRSYVSQESPEKNSTQRWMGFSRPVMWGNHELIGHPFLNGNPTIKKRITT